MRIEFDSLRNLVNLMCGNECIDQISLKDYVTLFGVGEAFRLAGWQGSTGYIPPEQLP